MLTESGFRRKLLVVQQGISKCEAFQPQRQGASLQQPYQADREGGIVFQDDQVPINLAERGGRTTAELRIRGTAGDNLDLREENKGFVPIYWEHVIFAVQADKLEFPPGKVQTNSLTTTSAAVSRH